jgi:hypothetical protein
MHRKRRIGGAHLGCDEEKHHCGTDKCIGWRFSLEKWSRISMAGGWFQLDGLGQFQDGRFLGSKNFCEIRNFSCNGMKAPAGCPSFLRRGSLLAVPSLSIAAARTAILPQRHRDAEDFLSPLRRCASALFLRRQPESQH